MKLGYIALALAAALPLQAADAIRLNSKPGSLKVRIEGTSNIHDWQVEGKLIGGFMEVGQNFPMEPGKAAEPGKADAKVEAFIPVRSLRSVEKDGSPYSTKMDDVMYEKMRVTEFDRVHFRLQEMVLKEASKAKDAPNVFDAKGEVVVAGVTNTITLPGDGQLKIVGSIGLKMTDFKMEPPAPAIAMGIIKTGDPVTVKFEWLVVQKKAAAPAK